IRTKALVAVMVSPGAVLAIEPGREGESHPKAIQPGDQRQNSVPVRGAHNHNIESGLQDFRRPLTLSHEPGQTSNIEHPTPNIEWQRESSLTSAFGVRCFPSVQGFQRAGDDKKARPGFRPNLAG